MKSIFSTLLAQTEFYYNIRLPSPCYRYVLYRSYISTLIHCNSSLFHSHHWLLWCDKYSQVFHRFCVRVFCVDRKTRFKQVAPKERYKLTDRDYSIEKILRIGRETRRSTIMSAIMDAVLFLFSSQSSSHFIFLKALPSVASVQRHRGIHCTVDGETIKRIAKHRIVRRRRAEADPRMVVVP